MSDKKKDVIRIDSKIGGMDDRLAGRIWEQRLDVPRRDWGGDDEDCPVALSKYIRVVAAADHLLRKNAAQRKRIEEHLCSRCIMAPFKKMEQNLARTHQLIGELQQEVDRLSRKEESGSVMVIGDPEPQTVTAVCPDCQGDFSADFAAESIICPDCGAVFRKLDGEFQQMGEGVLKCTN